MNPTLLWWIGFFGLGVSHSFVTGAREALREGNRGLAAFSYIVAFGVGLLSLCAMRAPFPGGTP